LLFFLTGSHPPGLLVFAPRSSRDSPVRERRVGSLPGRSQFAAGFFFCFFRDASPRPISPLLVSCLSVGEGDRLLQFFLSTPPPQL